MAKTDDKVRIRFIARAVAKGDTDGKQPTESFEPGDIVEVSMGSAMHWYSRGLAEFIQGDKPVQPQMLEPTAKQITRGKMPEAVKEKVS